MSEKKRSTYKRGSVGDLPPHIDTKKYSYRWLNASKLGKNSDYYDPRGWEIDKDANGEKTTREDRILGRMPIDMYEDMKLEKDEDRQRQMQMTQQNADAADAQLEHAFKKSGGKIKSSFTLTKN